MSAKPYEPFDHTADIGVRVHADNLTQLFEHAAFALMDTMVGVDRIRPATERFLEVAGDDLEELMVNWLSELLYQFEAEQWLFAAFEVMEVSPPRLTAKVRGERYDEQRHPVAADIKAVTYHQLKVAEVNGRWETEIIFDV